MWQRVSHKMSKWVEGLAGGGFCRVGRRPHSGVVNIDRQVGVPMRKIRCIAVALAVSALGFLGMSGVALASDSAEGFVQEESKAGSGALGQILFLGF